MPDHSASGPPAPRDTLAFIDFDAIRRRFSDAVPDLDFCSLRVYEERSEQLTVRQGVVQPVSTGVDVGGMVTVIHGGGLGYAATADLSDAGVAWAIREAVAWAERAAGLAVHDFSAVQMPHPRGAWASPVALPWEHTPLSAKLDRLRAAEAALRGDPRIVDSAAKLWRIRATSLYLTNGGGDVEQTADMIVPDLEVVAADDGVVQSRTLGGRGVCRQGGLEVLDGVGYDEAPARLVEEVLALLSAPECPTGTMDLVLAPDQMVLQIHESIGHPIELDRILGDERNYAGTSFVTPEMFGTYQYGSELLNVTFDPTHADEFASYAFDDDGVAATRVPLIERGVLLRPLGGVISQARAGLPGVANSRATSWNRPPIDRMANINVEPGDQPLEALIGGVERGVFMTSNCSWSIDDSRNKFQFGCELGRLIVDGELGPIVRNPNYRGVSASFWRSLSAVGDRSTAGIMGSPFCGKGEPNQIIRVGHASPTCVFSNVEIFGGDA